MRCPKLSPGYENIKKLPPFVKSETGNCWGDEAGRGERSYYQDGVSTLECPVVREEGGEPVRITEVTSLISEHPRN